LEFHEEGKLELLSALKLEEAILSSKYYGKPEIMPFMVVMNCVPDEKSALSWEMISVISYDLMGFRLV
jgi:hypothetical protein